MMNGQDALALSVGVQVPLWRGKQRAQAVEARAERRRAEARLEALRQEVETRIRDLQHRIERQRRQLALLDDTLLPKAETALEATLSAYRTGQNDFLDLLDAERTLFQLRLDRASTHARLLKTQAELDRTLGRAPLPAPASPETQ
jgi:outer membrane protein TolC